MYHTNDLNQLSSPPGANGNYGINQPVNAWPGASSDVVIWQVNIGDEVRQMGRDAGAAPDAPIMSRAFTDGAWSEWSESGGSEPAPPVPDQPPVVSNLVPTGGEEGVATTIHVYGANFDSASRIWAAGSERVTTFVSASELTWAAAAAQMVPPSFDVWVVNDDDQESARLSFTVTPEA